jgi:20S proteasome alpha/beta subunit
MANISLLQSVFVVSIWLAWISQQSSPVHASSFSEGATSPVVKWENSWTASCVQSTTVAVSCTIGEEEEEQQRGVIVILKGGGVGSNPLYRKDYVDDSMWIEVEGLRVLPRRPDQVTTMDSSLRWTMLGSSTVCCMTGLVSDVDYLSRVLQKHVDLHRIMYEGSRVMNALELVREAALELQEAAQYENGRPYGVQALFVGSRLASSRNGNKLTLLTLDPSGGFRHWGYATAIGRDASLVRQRLYNSLSKRDAQCSAKAALDVGLHALIGAEHGSSSETRLEDGGSVNIPEVLIVLRDKSRSTISVATVDPDVVEACVRRLSSEESSSMFGSS